MDELLESYDDFVNESKGKVKVEMKKLMKNLEKAIKHAERIGEMSNSGGPEPDDFDGNEAHDVEQMLEEVYNALMTGNRNDDMRRDEFFK